MGDLISVVIPVYNAEKYLTKCLDSVLAQSHENLEIILVDDGSSDGSSDICEEYARNDRRIKVVHKQNSGPGAARRDGVKLATGDFIGFVDADDYIDRDMYKRLYEAARNFDIVQCGFKRVGTDGTIIKAREMAPCEVHGSYECALYYVRQKNTTNFLWNKLFRRELFKDVIFPELYAGEDSCVLTQLYTYAGNVCTVRDILYNWVMTPHSLCRKPFSREKLDVVRAGQFMHDFYETHLPELAPYAAFYICYWAAEAYFEAGSTEIHDKSEIQEWLLDVFHQYYSVVRKSQRDLVRTYGKKTFVNLFRLSPKLGYVAYRLRH